jgi:hypothetical protein
MTTTIRIGRLCDLLGLSEQRVRELVEEGVIPAGVHNEFPLFDVVQKYVKFLNERKEP